MRTNLASNCEKTPSALAIANEPTGSAEDRQSSARLRQASPVTTGAANDQNSSRLVVAHGIACVAKDHNATRPESSTRAVDRGALGDDHEAGRVQIGRQFRPGPTENLDNGLPASSQAGGQQSLPFGPLKPNERVALVEESHQLGINLLIVPDLGNQ